MTSSAAKWFQDKVKGLPQECIVRTSVDVRPESVPGNHVSVVLRPQVRTWGFPTVEEADAFRARYASRIRKQNQLRLPGERAG